MTCLPCLLGSLRLRACSCFDMWSSSCVALQHYAAQGGHTGSRLFYFFLRVFLGVRCWDGGVRGSTWDTAATVCRNSRILEKSVGSGQCRVDRGDDAPCDSPHGVRGAAERLGQVRRALDGGWRQQDWQHGFLRPDLWPLLFQLWWSPPPLAGLISRCVFSCGASDPSSVGEKGRNLNFDLI